MEPGRVPAADGAVGRALGITQGQPWLVNALAKVSVEELVPDRVQPIRREDLERARALLISRRETHLDSLTERLREPLNARAVRGR